MTLPPIVRETWTLCRQQRPVRWAVASGAAALMYQVVLQKLFSYILGGALLSTTIVVGSYMAGLALGGFAAGVVGDRVARRRNLHLYLFLELGIGALGIGALLLYQAWLGTGGVLLQDPGNAALFASLGVRAAVVFALLLPMTTLIGATLPILLEAVRPLSVANAVSIPALYSANLLGAIGGVFVSAFVILPWLGLWGATIAAALLNLGIFISGLAAARGINAAHDKPALPAAPEASADAPAAPTPPRLDPVSANLLSFASGLVVFALEIVWSHLLSIVIGASVYAFALMLLAVLAALFIAARQEDVGSDGRHQSLSRLILTGAVLLAITVPLFPLAPWVFGIAGTLGPGFVVRDVIRLAVACALIVPPGAYLSRVLPRLLTVAVPRERESLAVGILLGVNTMGCLAGLLLGQFVLIPMLGSELSLKVLVLVLTAAAMLAARRHPDVDAKPLLAGGRRKLVAALTVVALAVPDWYPPWLLSARGNYFNYRSRLSYDEMIYLGEDAETGFISVTRKDDILELRTNGKFEGDDKGQMAAQLAFGYLPVLAAAKTKRAFLIGIGTGTSLRALADFPFDHLDVAEFAQAMYHAARTYFGTANHQALEDPRVKVVFDDGRSALALSAGNYDVISAEVTSIWFAGAANLYSHDFYDVVKRKLAPGGVFQQWVQLHHMRFFDLWVILQTVHSAFPHVAVWYAGGQGQILASEQPIHLDWGRLGYAISRADSQDDLYRELHAIPFNVLLDERGVDRFVESQRADAGDPNGDRYISSDLHPYLEYGTPKGNTLDKQDDINLHQLELLRAEPVEVPLRNLDEAEKPVAEAVRAFSARDCGEVEQFRLAHPEWATRADLHFLGSCARRSVLSVEGPSNL